MFVNKELLLFQIEHAAQALKYAEAYSHSQAGGGLHHPTSLTEVLAGLASGIDALKVLVEHDLTES